MKLSPKISIIPTLSTEHFAKKFVKHKKIKIIFLDVNKDNKRFFPDGEVYVKIPNINSLKGRVVVLHSGMPDPNDGLVELEMILELLKSNNNVIVEVFFTYFPYSMQDEVFYKGEINVAEKLIKKLINYYNVKKIYAIDPHFAGKKWVNKYPFVSISALSLLAKQASLLYPDMVCVAPDIGSQRRTKLKGVSKKRINSFVVQTVHDDNFVKSIKGRVVGVVDDIIETGGTMDHFYDKCVDCGATKVVALITHGVLLAGIKRIKEKYIKLFLTNTIDREDANINVSNFILENLLN